MDKDLVDYFIAETNKKFERVELEFEKVDRKLEQLMAFKWKVIGASAAVTAAVNVAAYFLTNR